MRRYAPVYLHGLGMVCALGDQPALILERLKTAQSTAMTTESFGCGPPETVGRVKTDLPSMESMPLHARNRCNQLLLVAVAQLAHCLTKQRKGVDPGRVGVILGTSTSGINEGSEAIAHKLERGVLPEHFDYGQQEMSNPAEFLADELEARGPVLTISTACSSGAKALASARRLLNLGICDVVVAGGVDALCDLTVKGFKALDAVSPVESNPFSRNRQGINIGEGAALFVLSREKGEITLAGVGESSDAYHISGPAPDGKGAIAAIEQALNDARLMPGDIDYVNLHGTATEQNDRVESLAVNKVLGENVACSSTKAYSGHTLGAAGAIEAGFCWLALNAETSESRLPIHRWDGVKDESLAPLNFVNAEECYQSPKTALSNSFAFGGNNIAIILNRAKHRSDSADR